MGIAIIILGAVIVCLLLHILGQNKEIEFYKQHLKENLQKKIGEGK
ncbi:MAG: hypothetical protein HN952_06150 [Candidatus Cloacimonetes bacterium]|jgi:hypothetical protein|nr:hypothetical protein [Candidatus Cloacimonadota bacterium]